MFEPFQPQTSTGRYSRTSKTSPSCIATTALLRRKRPSENFVERQKSDNDLLCLSVGELFVEVLFVKVLVFLDLLFRDHDNAWLSGNAVLCTYRIVAGRLKR